MECNSIKLLIRISGSTISIDRTLCSIYVALTILNQHPTTTSLISCNPTFSIRRLSTIYIYIVFLVLHLRESIMILNILHNRMVHRLVCSRRFTWFLRSSSWLCCWICSWVIEHKTIFRYILHEWIIMRVSPRHDCTTLWASVNLMMLRSFHLNLLKLFV